MKDGFTIAVALFCYGGSNRAELTRWYADLMYRLRRDGRISLVGEIPVDVSPTDVARNFAVDCAQRNQSGYLLMLDADTIPHPDWWPVAWELILNRRQSGPAIVAAPYCGPSPQNLVYAHDWGGDRSKSDPRWTLEKINRVDAARRTGVSEVASPAAGCCLIDMRAFDRVAKPYFRFERNDDGTEAVSTDETPLFRDLGRAGVPSFVTWDHWATHAKSELVGKPAPITSREVEHDLRLAVRTEPGLRFIRDRFVGEGQHRGGWPWAMKSLSPLADRHGIVFDDFIEQTFGYEHDPESGSAIAHNEPWIGAFHHPPNIPIFCDQSSSLPRIFRRRHWIESAKNLKLAICLTEYLASWLADHIDCPIVPLHYPTETNVQQFNPTSLFEYSRPRLIQVGWYMRDTTAIERVDSPSWLHPTRIVIDNPYAVEHEAEVSLYLESKGISRRPQGVESMHTVGNEQYDVLLASNVVFLNLLDASASTTVVECIARSTPLVVNRHPAVVEYLGAKYPLFYDGLDQVGRLLDKSRIVEAHQYLAEIDKTPYTAESWRKSIQEAISLVA